MSKERLSGTVAFVLIKADLGAALRVAEEVSKTNWLVDGNLMGVRWASVVTGPYDVVAAVLVEDNEALGKLIVDHIQRVDGVSIPGTLVATETFSEVLLGGHSGFP